MEKSSRIFVAGAGGLVGSAILEALTARGYSNVLSPSHAELNLEDKNAVRAFFEKEKPEYVILAAARVGGIKANMTYPADFLHQNLAIQENVMWEAHTAGVKKLVFLGSSCIYPREAAQPIKEDYFMTGPLEPTNEGYAVAKIAGMKLAQMIFTQYGTPFISCMPTNVYGPRDHFDPERGHVIPALIRRMHEAKQSGASEVSIWGSGNAKREFLFSEDLADAIIFLLESYESREFLNVGTGEDVSIRELATLIQEIVGFEGTLAFDATKPDGMPRKLLEVSKMHALGWKHKTALRDGITKTYQWYLENAGR